MSKKNRKILFFLMPLFGHVNPNLKLIERLVKSKFDVYCVCDNKFNDVIISRGAELIEYPEEVLTYFSCPNTDHQLLQSSQRSYYDNQMNTETIIKACDESINLSRTVYHKLISDLKALNPDIVLYDSLAMWGSLFGESLEVPYHIIEAATFNNIHLSKTYFMEYFKNVVEKELNEQIDMNSTMNAYESINKLVCRSFSRIIRSKRRLSFEPHSYMGHMGQDMQIDNSSYDDKYHYLGFSQDFPKKNLEKENQIFVTRGTMQDEYNMNLLLKIIDSIAKTDQYKIIGTTGIKNSQHHKNLVKEFVRENVSIESFVNQIEVLERSKVMVCHGGITGVRESIFSCTPMVIFPTNYHCYQVGLAIEENGLGILLKDHPFNPKELNDAIQEILENEEYEERLKGFRNKLMDKWEENIIAQLI